MKIKTIIISFFFINQSTAFAEWTNDTDANGGYFSNVVITKLSVGQIDKASYVCLAFKNEVAEKKACFGNSTSGIWRFGFDVLYKQALYFYSTGQKIRVYVANLVWKFKPFTDFYGDMHITGFSTCDNKGVCFGPAAPGKRL